jgi:hypothetical protein
MWPYSDLDNRTRVCRSKQNQANRPHEGSCLVSKHHAIVYAFSPTAICIKVTFCGPSRGVISISSCLGHLHSYIWPIRVILESGQLSRYRCGLRGSKPGSGKIFLSSTTFRPALGHSQPAIQWVPGVHSLAVKRLGSESDKLSPPTAEVKNGGAKPPLLHMSSWHSD